MTGEWATLFVTSQHLDMSRCWALAMRCGKVVVQQVVRWCMVLYNMSVAGVRVVEFGTNYWFFMPPPSVVFLSCSSVRSSVCPCVHSETLLTRYLAECLTHFHQTYINDALWDRDEHFTIWGQKVKGQGHGGIKYAGNSTFWAS